MTTKTTLLWSLTALCGVVGGWVAHYGGWSRFNPSLPTIRITKVVYVTNEVTLTQGRVVNGWDEPLKPLDEERHSLNLMVSNATATNVTITFPMRNIVVYSNIIYSSPGVTNINHWFITNNFIHFATNGYSL